MASYLYRTAQPSTLAIFRSWGSSTGAGRIRLAAANINKKASPPFPACRQAGSSPRDMRQYSCAYPRPTGHPGRQTFLLPNFADE